MTDLDSLGTRIRAKRRELDSQVGEARVVQQRHDELMDEMLKLTKDISVHERATVLLNSIGENRQFKAQEAIEQLVTRGLQTIFDESLSFHIIQSVSGSRAEVSFMVRSELENGKVVDTSVIDARGGGLAAIVGFLLRLVVLLLRNGDAKSDDFMILDETFAHVSDEYLPALGEFIRKIVDKTGVQILMVTHQPEFTEWADKVYRISSVDGKSVVKEES